ncbi:hypothetical protein MRX96_033209 [Rhipicephalus microplus]
MTGRANDLASDSDMREKKSISASRDQPLKSSERVARQDFTQKIKSMAQSIDLMAQIMAWSTNTIARSTAWSTDTAA